MSVTTLSHSSSWNPGADLWVVADFKNSRWSAKIDWHLNFQIVKAQRHKLESLSPFLINVLERTGLPQPEFRKDENSPLLISSSHLLPNKWVLVVSYSEKIQDWVETLSKAWTDLKKPSLRVFLPSQQNPSFFSELWMKKNPYYDLTLVLD